MWPIRVHSPVSLIQGGAGLQPEGAVYTGDWVDGARSGKGDESYLLEIHPSFTMHDMRANMRFTFFYLQHVICSIRLKEIAHALRSSRARGVSCNLCSVLEPEPAPQFMKYS